MTDSCCLRRLLHHLRLGLHLLGLHRLEDLCHHHRLGLHLHQVDHDLADSMATAMVAAMVAAVVAVAEADGLHHHLSFHLRLPEEDDGRLHRHHQDAGVSKRQLYRLA